MTNAAHRNRVSKAARECGFLEQARTTTNAGHGKRIPETAAKYGTWENSMGHPEEAYGM